MSRARIGYALSAALTIAALASGCVSAPPSNPKSGPPSGSAAGAGGGGYYENDGPPVNENIDISAVPNAVPRNEPRSARGNPSSYEALGRTYYVLRNAAGFSQTGRASWYGRQFHGKRTSSGERYSMFKMTAAHKRLPIPSYVRVTDLDNHKQVIVRVNDRGPFHKGRIIDLSYVAARRLGIVAQGSAPVRIETVTPASLRAERKQQQARVRRRASQAKPEADAATTTDASVDKHKPRASIDAARGRPIPVANVAGATAGRAGYYLQSGAFSRRDNAVDLRARLNAAGFDNVVIVPPDDGMRLYRVRLGPFANARGRKLTRRLLDRRGYAARNAAR